VLVDTHSGAGAYKSTLGPTVTQAQAGHKILKIGIQPGQETEVVTMTIECCSQERTYKRFYGLLAQRFAQVNKEYRVREPPLRYLVTPWAGRLALSTQQ
jgi:hypothetical protein